jgi:WD40 repeat protein
MDFTAKATPLHRGCRMRYNQRKATGKEEADAMNDFLRDRLCDLLARHGRPLLDDRPRCEALLWLAAGENSHGMFALTGALERKVPQAILTAPPERRDAELLAKLTRRLVSDLDMDETAARWAVESWARAVAAAPAQPLLAPEPLAQQPPPSRPARPHSTPAVSPEFSTLPDLTLDAGPAPLPPPPPREEALVNLDRFFTGREPEGVFLQGSTEGVSCLACCPDGSILATGHDDGTIKLWDARSGRLSAVLPGHGGRVRDLSFTPGGHHLASAGQDGLLKIWDRSARADPVTLEGHQGPATCAAFSPDGGTVVSGGTDGTIRIWDPGSGALRRTLTGHAEEVTSLAYCPDGRTVASGSLDQTVKLWDIGFGSYWATLEGHPGGVTALAYAPNGELLVTGGHDWSMRLWNALTGSALATLAGELEGHTQPVCCVAFAPNGWTIASGGADEAVRVWDVAARRELCCFTGHTGPVRAVAYTPDGEWLISAGADGTVRRRRAPEAERPAPARRSFEAPKPRSSSVGKASAWGGAALVVIWLLIRLTTSASRSSPQPQPQRFDMRAALRQHPPPIWGDQQGADLLPAQERLLVGHQGGVAAVAIASDGRTALSGGFDRMVRLWDLTNGQELRRLDGHTAPVLGVALSPDGRRALSGSLDRTVRLWDVQTGQELRRLDTFRSGAVCVAFSPDGQRFAVGCGFASVSHDIVKDPAVPSFERLRWFRPQPPDRTVTVWDTDTGRLVATLRGHNDEVSSVAFTPDGKRLVSGGFDCTAILWDVATSKVIRRFRGHIGEILGVAVSPDGKHLLTCSGKLGPVAGNGPDKDKIEEKKPEPPRAPDNKPRLWDLATGLELRPLRGHWHVVLGVAFSPDGRRALSGGMDKTVRLWDVATGEVIRTFQGHGYGVQAVAFTPDGRRALSASWDGNLRLWRLPP